MIALIAAAVMISFGIRRLYNHRTDVWRARLAAPWTDDLDPVAIKIEIYGLGRYAGRNDEVTGVHLPADLLLMLADRYGIKASELMRAYTQGVLDALGERGAYPGAVQISHPGLGEREERLQSGPDSAGGKGE